MIAVHEFLTEDGQSPFGEWFLGLDRRASAKVRAASVRLGDGNFSCVEGVGEGVYEYKIDYGPGYRVYFGKDGQHLILLLGGGTKQRQIRDIAKAKACWRNYKRRKKQE